MAELVVTADQERALSRFFRIYFYGDNLRHQDSLDEALADYLNSESRDPGGNQLHDGLQQMIVADLSEDELRPLIEQSWEAETVAELMEIEYRAVLFELVRKLEAKA